jgi:hypothetical protein
MGQPEVSSPAPAAFPGKNGHSSNVGIRKINPRTAEQSLSFVSPQELAELNRLSTRISGRGTSCFGRQELRRDLNRSIADSIRTIVARRLFVPQDVPQKKVMIPPIRISTVQRQPVYIKDTDQSRTPVVDETLWESRLLGAIKPAQRRSYDLDG